MSTTSSFLVFLISLYFFVYLPLSSTHLLIHMHHILVLKLLYELFYSIIDVGIYSNLFYKYYTKIVLL